MGKINQIARCDWLPEWARWSCIARSGPPAVLREKNFPASQLINPLLTKLFRSRWLDIGLVLFFLKLRQGFSVKFGGHVIFISHSNSCLWLTCTTHFYNFQTRTLIMAWYMYHVLILFQKASWIVYRNEAKSSYQVICECLTVCFLITN